MKFAAVLVALFCVTAVHAAETPPRLLKGEPAVAPKTATADGWVLLRFGVTKDGKPDNIRVGRSYPQGVFDAAAMDALKTYEFQPKMVNGAAVDEPQHAMRFVFNGSGDTGVRSQYAGLIRDIQRDIRKGDLVAAEARLADLNKAFKAEALNLTELARYYELSGLILNTKQQYLDAAEHIEAALRLYDYFDNPKVVDSLHAQMVYAFVSMGQYHNAVDYFASWSRQTGGKGPDAGSKQLAATVEKLQKEGYGRGRVFEIAVSSES
ncbi:MAG: energy transducer TonB [Rhodospirillaceae bacterium]|nr:energy transducer TonB [Rhodospirillaceae bacterium]